MADIKIDASKQRALEILSGIEVSAEDRKILESHLKGGGKAKRLSEAQLLEKYPHLIPGTLSFNEKTNKQEGTIKCTFKGCSTERRVATSDMHQVNMCEEHKKEQTKAKKEAKAKRLEQLLAEHPDLA